MPAVTTDITIEQGATWAHGWMVNCNGDPIDATWTARGQIRARASDTAVLHQFAADVTALEGAVVIAVDPEESAAWDWRIGVYDVEVVNADQSLTLRVAQGRVIVSPEVTR